MDQETDQDRRMKELTNKEWTKLIDEKKLKLRPKQYPYYQRTTAFLQDENDIQVNPGGMGLGKTFAICKAIEDNIEQFESIFIATPTSNLKDTWAKELNSFNNNKNMIYSVWLAKSDMCFERKLDKKFNLTLCNDDCIYRRNLEANRVYTEECNLLADNLTFPIKIDEYYAPHVNFEQKIIPACLLPIVRNKIKNFTKVTIGDYFGFIFEGMYDHIVACNRNNSCLIIDEAHKIPDRVSSLLSKEILLNKIIVGLKEEKSCDYLKEHPDLYINFEKLISSLEQIFNELEKILGIKDFEARISYIIFKEQIEKRTNFTINDCIDLLKGISEKGLNEKDYETESSSCKRLKEFIQHWSNKASLPEYTERFQYVKFKNSKRKEIKIIVACNNPAEFLQKIWEKWNKIIMCSGTMPNEEYFRDKVGLNNNIKVKFEENISSYKIKDDVLIYPVGNFTSKFRNNTYDVYTPQLINILNSVKGRTIIYVQNKTNSVKLEQKLQNFKVFNFCKTEDGDDIDKNNYARLKENFIKSKKGIAIINIRGRVEGENFLDENNETVKNIIVFGYPFANRGFEYTDLVAYWTLKLNGNEVKAKEYVEFRPTANLLYQAAMRAKRKEEDTPLIILWDKTFNKNCPGYKYLDKDLQGRLIYSYEDLLKEVKKID